MPVTDAQIEIGAIALFTANNAPGQIDLVKAKWPDYPDDEKNVYRRYAKAVLDAVLVSET